MRQRLSTCICFALALTLALSASKSGGVAPDSANNLPAFADEHQMHFNSERYCGPLAARIAMLDQGIDANVDDIARAARIRYDGTSLYGLFRACESMGAQVHLAQLTDEEAAAAAIPYIVRHKVNPHFVLIRSRTYANATVYDPANQRSATVNWAEFRRNHEDVALSFAPAPDSGYVLSKTAAFAAIFLGTVILGACARFLARRSPKIVARSTMFAVAGLACCATQADTHKLTVDPENVNLGTVLPSSETVRQLTVRNTGTESATLGTISSTCTCTAAQVPSEPIGPGESAEVQLTIHAPPRATSFSSTVTIPVLDSAPLIVTVVGVVDEKPSYSVDPNEVRLPTVTRGSPLRGKTLSLKRNSGKAFNAIEVKIEGDFFSVERRPASEEYFEDTAEFVVQYLSTDRAGKATGAIILDVQLLDSKKIQFRIPVFATILPLVEIVGGGGELGVLERGRTYQFQVHLALNATGARISSVSDSREDLAVTLKRADENGAALAVTCTPSAAGEFYGEIEILVDQTTGAISSERVRIPISGYVQ